MNRQVIVQPSITAVDIIETPIPIPQDHELVIKVIVAGSNPKDWKMPLWKNHPHNSGDDIAGIVHAVGKNVYEFKPGDRVAAAHEFSTPNGSYADYSIAPDYSAFHIPHGISFEEAATIPSAALTAALAIYGDLKVPPPYDIAPTVEGKKSPILIYGITTAVGAFAAKFARLSGLGPVIGVAGRAAEYAKTLADHVVDYRQDEETLVSAIEDVLTKDGLPNKLPYVFDAVSENGSLEATLRIIDTNGGRVSTVLPPKLFARDPETFEYPSGVIAINTAVPKVQSERKDFGYVWSRYFSRLLADGRLSAHPHEVIPRGLHGVLKGLKKLKAGRASGMKYVYRIEETDDAAILGSIVAQGGDDEDLADVSGVQTSQIPQGIRDFKFSL